MFSVLCVCAWNQGPSDERGLLQHVQVVGTHNSYHIPPPDAIQQLAWDPAVQTLAADYAQSAVNTTQYSHLGLYQQLDLGDHV